MRATVSREKNNIKDFGNFNSKNDDRSATEKVRRAGIDRREKSGNLVIPDNNKNLEFRKKEGTARVITGETRRKKDI